jgi:hypothetical protein
MYGCAKTASITAGPAANPVTCRLNIRSRQTSSYLLTSWLAAIDSLMMADEATVHTQTLQSQKLRGVG